MVGLEGKGATRQKYSQCDGCVRAVEEFTEVMNTDTIEDLIVMSEVRNYLLNFIPSYREVLTHSPLPIYAGGEILSNPGENIGKVEGARSTLTSGLGGEDALLKGVVLGGLENDFSSLKTRSARKLGKEKENLNSNSLLGLTGPRALRAQKALERVKR
jgi:hypothetical protein